VGKKHSHLSLEEREMIGMMPAQGKREGAVSPRSLLRLRARNDKLALFNLRSRAYFNIRP